jgi:hypothetical protein
VLIIVIIVISQASQLMSMLPSMTLAFTSQRADLHTKQMLLRAITSLSLLDRTLVANHSSVNLLRQLVETCVTLDDVDVQCTTLQLALACTAAHTFTRTIAESSVIMQSLTVIRIRLLCVYRMSNMLII